MAPNENEKAAADLAAEREKLGFGTKKTKDQGENTELNDEESEDMGDLDEEEEQDEEETEDEEEESDEESEDESDEDEEEEEEEDQPHKKKGIPFKIHNQLRKDLRKAQADLAKAIDEKKVIESKLPDDFEERVKTLAAEIGVSDPENMTKLMKLAREAASGEISELKEKLTALEQKVQDNNAVAVVDEFPKEWESFEKDFFTTEYPNATPEQIKSAKKVMENLAKTRGIGGKAYIDEKSGKEVLDPYPLDYIFYKNKKEFEYIVTGKKVKGMEKSRTQGITPEKKNDGEIQHLPKNAKSSDIRNLDKKYAQLESGSDDGLRSPENNNI